MSYGKRARKITPLERSALERQFKQLVVKIARATPSEAQPLIDEGVALAAALGWCLWTAVATCHRRHRRPSNSAIRVSHHRR